MRQRQELTFEEVDDFLLSLEIGHSNPPDLHQKTEPGQLGPVAELLCADLPEGVLDLEPLIRFVQPPGMVQRSREGERHGFFPIQRQAEDPDSWQLFCLEAQQAARAAGFAKRTAQGFVAAMLELEDNIHCHSEALETGFVAFRSARSEFEFVVADRGIGVLKSLRCEPSFANVKDSGAALRLALADGSSRHGEASGHGHGFRPLFVGLANTRGKLRFHSSDHCLEISGENPALVSARIHQRPFIPGLQVSVVCK